MWFVFELGAGAREQSWGPELTKVDLIHIKLVDLHFKVGIMHIFRCKESFYLFNFGIWNKH